MKSLKRHIQENLKFKINRDTKVSEYYPKTWDELRQIIENRFKELGPGTKAEPINFNDIDVSRMTTFYNGGVFNGTGIFQNTKFEYIDVSEWDVSNIINMSDMFAVCNKLKSIGDISNWDISNIKYMPGMFYGCKNLKSVGDLSNWDVSNVIDIGSMFFDCSKLKSIGDISNWNISNIKYMNHTFCNCEQLKSVGDLSDWNVSNVENINSMFDYSGITNTPKWYKE